MELTKEFIEENQLNEEQVTAITSHFESTHNKVMGEQVHEHVEKSLGKIWGSVKERTGIEREQGEKYADAIERASNLYFEGTKTSLQRKESELEEKIKNLKGDDSLKSELEAAKEQLTALKQKEAEYDDWAKNDYKGKYESTLEELTATQRRVAFASSRPAKPENVNQYEWDAKWKAWEKSVIEENTIVFDEDGEAWAVNKNNEFKKEKISTLAGQNEELQGLLKEREQRGTGTGKDGKKIDIEGVPFKVPENATPKERQTAIREYLAGQNITPVSPEYPKMYGELNKKILGLEKAS